MCPHTVASLPFFLNIVFISPYEMLLKKETIMHWQILHIRTVIVNSLRWLNY